MADLARLQKSKHCNGVSWAEDRAWKTLRRLRDEGIHVTRQHRIGRYVVDFAIRKARIAIEIDGGVHRLPGRAAKDAERQIHVERLGWRFLRFTDRDVLNEDFILDAVRVALPLPSRGGEKGVGCNANLSNETLTHDNASDSAFPKNLQRRTRANRNLPPRRKPSPLKQW